MCTTYTIAPLTALGYVNDKNLNKTNMNTVKYGLLTACMLLTCCSFDRKEEIKRELDTNNYKISSFKKIINMLNVRQDSVNSELDKAKSRSDSAYIAGLQIQSNDIKKYLDMYADSLENAELLMVSLKERLRE